jgi:hypothetical protein
VITRQDGDAMKASRRHRGIWGRRRFESAQPGDVIVMNSGPALTPPAGAATCRSAPNCDRSPAVIVDGPARDIDEAREYDFPVFARSDNARTARGRIVEVATNVPITSAMSPSIRAISWSRTGSGVVFVAKRQRRTGARSRRSRDRPRARDGGGAMREGTPISQVMGTSYETMLKK